VRGELAEKPNLTPAAEEPGRPGGGGETDMAKSLLRFERERIAQRRAFEGVVSMADHRLVRATGGDV
jgi:hypothetical protein